MTIFSHGFEEMIASRKASFFARHQQRAHEKYLQVGLPTLKHEAFKQCQLKKIYSIDPKRPLYGESQSTEADIVICDHKVTIRQPIEGVDLIDLVHLPPSYTPFIDRRMQLLVKQIECPFGLLNLSLNMEGIFIFIPKGKQLSRPIHIAIDRNSSIQQQTKIFFVAGERSSAQVILSYIGTEEGFENDLIDVTLEKGAMLDWMIEHRGLSQGVTHAQMQASIKRDAELKVHVLEKGSPLFRFIFEAQLLEEGAFCDIKGLAIAEAQEEMHNVIKIHHKAESTRSNQLIKHLLVEHSKTSFMGKIYVDACAQMTNAYQLNRNLLLSPTSSAHSKPGLEIFADDVKASHGATIAHLDEELAFYLKARGLSQEEARHFLIRAFVKEIFESMAYQPLQDQWQALPLY
ncbi:MAG: SufD family Fe-S cluster assembly protein [Simkaniaceae bacterium]|nr:SufD family Fe-S cluster assembly protein [Simkaniaceae bacterium]MCF7852399.1 SufD family Fe-S cluster assembly protein [Simkaniaceae bacterium]